MTPADKLATLRTAVATLRTDGHNELANEVCDVIEMKTADKLVDADALVSFNATLEMPECQGDMDRSHKHADRWIAELLERLGFRTLAGRYHKLCLDDFWYS